MLKTVVAAEDTAEAVAFWRFSVDNDNGFHIGRVGGSGIGYYRNILYVVGIELLEFQKVVDLAAVDVYCRRSFAEDFKSAVVVYYHRYACQHIGGRSCDGEGGPFHIRYECVAFHRRGGSGGAYHYFSELQ